MLGFISIAPRWLLLAGLAALSAVALSGCFEPTKDTHPDQVLTKRRAIFKQFTRTLEPIALVANDRKEYQKDAFLLSVQDLEKLSTKPWIYFPADGNYPPTHARPTVWTQPAEFKAAQKKYQGTVKQLVQAAQIGDLDRIKLAVSDVTNSCKACHKQFRYE